MRTYKRYILQGNMDLRLFFRGLQLVLRVRPAPLVARSLGPREVLLPLSQAWVAGSPPLLAHPNALIGV